jgi:D-alanyl-D-alanine endopeptidase (penicillin-binding protein 7)
MWRAAVAVGLLLTVWQYCSAAQSSRSDPPSISATSYVVLNLDGSIVAQRRAGVRRPIASISKILIASQLENLVSENDITTIESSDIVAYNRLLKSGDIYKSEELLQLALITSNNSAIVALNRHYGNVINQFNSVAASSDAESINVVEPSGLDVRNTASAADLAKFILTLTDTKIANISVRPWVIINQVQYNSTNPLIRKPGWKFILSKTGFTNPAGGCLAVITAIGGEWRAVVILGSRDAHERWKDLARLRSALAPADEFWGKVEKAKSGTPAVKSSTKKSSKSKRK